MSNSHEMFILEKEIRWVRNMNILWKIKAFSLASGEWGGANASPWNLGMLIGDFE